ncbi:hypothetical protein L8Q45_15715, partial [Enterobacter roggenkampii]|nr:hypothetical protein [Enterobacter roggenkampii]
MVRASRCHRLNMKTYIINGSEVSRLSVAIQGAFSWAAEYTYRLDKEKLTDYSLEQQASILADYWLLLVYGISKWSYYQRPGRMGMYRGVDLLQDVPSLYQKIVTGKGR